MEDREQRECWLQQPSRVPWEGTGASSRQISPHQQRILCVCLLYQSNTLTATPAVLYSQILYIYYANTSTANTCTYITIHTPGPKLIPILYRLYHLYHLHHLYLHLCQQLPDQPAPPVYSQILHIWRYIYSSNTCATNTCTSITIHNLRPKLIPILYQVSRLCLQLPVQPAPPVHSQILHIYYICTFTCKQNCRQQCKGGDTLQTTK